MNTKEFLNQAFYLNLKIQKKTERIERLRAMLERLAPYISDMSKIQGGGDDDKLANGVAKIVDLQSEVKELAEKLADISCEIADTIEELSDKRQCEVLTKRYLEFKQWSLISEEMHFSYHYVHDLHRRGINHIAKIIQNNTKSYKASNK